MTDMKQNLAEKPYLKRRDFFARLTEASVELLGANTFHGSLDDVKYTFIPGQHRDLQTLLVVGGLRLDDSLYSANFNLIFIKDWPDTTHNTSFWRKLLLRHDLLDEIHILCRHMPARTSSYFKSIVCFDAAALSSTSLATAIPTLLFVPPGALSHTPALQNFAAGSDVYVDTPATLNTAGSPAHQRLLAFYQQFTA